MEAIQESFVTITLTSQEAEHLREYLDFATECEIPGVSPDAEEIAHEVLTLLNDLLIFD